jgi:hypothetical protein
MKARGKRKAKRSASPLDCDKREEVRPEKVGIYRRYYALFRAIQSLNDVTQGRRASRLPLAVIFPRLWRSASTFEAEHVWHVGIRKQL